MEWQYLKCPQSRGFSKKKFSREDELMSHMLRDPEVKSYICSWLKEKERGLKIKKSLELAQIYNKAGNNEFKSANYAASIGSYTASAFHAPKDSCDLPKAIANRSAALFYLNRYKDCIKDIDLALYWGYPAELSHKLYLRKARSYIKLHGVNGTETLASKLEKILKSHDKIAQPSNDEVKKTSELLKACFLREDTTGTVTDEPLDPRLKVAFGTNPEIPNASSGINRAFSQEKGNYAVTNRKIKTGQILFVEKPVAWLPLTESARTDICSNCCRSVRDVPIPCTACLNIAYCSIECSNEALSSHHSWECPGYQTGIWKAIGVTALPLRTLLSCTAATNASRYNEINNLVTNVEKIPSSKLYPIGVTAAMLTTYLANYTDYFKVYDLEKCLLPKFSNDTCNFSKILTISKDRELYVGSLLLRYCLQLYFNSQSITKFELEEDPHIVYRGEEKHFAIGIYPSARIMHHSCKPNVVTIFANQCLIVTAVKDIEKGDEVSMCYGVHYQHMTRRTRQEVLKELYFFVCKCEACTLPEYRKFLEQYEAKCCQKCKNVLHMEDDGNYPKKCEICSFVPCPREYKKAFAEISKLSSLKDRLFGLAQFSEAVKVLKKILAIRKRVLYKYHNNISDTLNKMSAMYILMGNCLEAISCQEEVLLGLISRFGPLHLDIAKQQSDIVSLYLRYLESENVTDAKHRETESKIRMYLSDIRTILSVLLGTWSDGYISAVEKSAQILDVVARYRP